MRRRNVALSILIVVVLVAASFYVYLVIGPVTCCAPPPSSSSSQSGQVTTQPYPPTTNVSQQFVMLSYDFQVNGSAGSLFVVIKNYGNSGTSVSSVSFDGAPFNGSGLTLDSGCQNFVSGAECGITLAFGPGSLPAPADGSNHSLVVVTAGGNQLGYNVTAGELYHRACTYTSSC